MLIFDDVTFLVRYDKVTDSEVCPLMLVKL